jgi:hypothetical protein
MINPLCAGTQGMIHFTPLLCGIQGLLLPDLAGGAFPRPPTRRARPWDDDDEIIEIITAIIGSGILK